MECSTSIVGVPPVLGLARFHAEPFHHFRESHFVGLAHAQIDDLRAGMRGHRRPLGAFDLLEFVDGCGLAVLAAANPFRDQVLNV
jgi:hypothetical protein